MKCLVCSKETNNDKFCSRSCSTSFNNRGKHKGPKKKNRTYCRLCNKETNFRAFCCKEHKTEWMIENNDNFRKHPSQHYKKIAGKNAREIYLKHKPHKCEICGYDKIVEVHHIKELKLFEPDYEKANSIENLIGLCPNHHKELHFGLISL